MQLRFDDADEGSILVVDVLVPPNEFIPFTVVSDDNGTAAIDVVTNVDGWRVEVGLLGLPGALLSEHDLPDHPNAEPLRHGVDQVAFDKVWFGYPGRAPVLRDFDLTIDCAVAPVAPVGSGATPRAACDRPPRTPR